MMSAPSSKNRFETYFFASFVLPCIEIAFFFKRTASFHYQILKEIEENDIGIYRFPDLGGDDDDDVAAVSMKVSINS